MTRKSTRRLCIAGYAEILRGLFDAPATSGGLAQRHNVTPHVMRGITRRLHQLRMIRVAEWRKPVQGPAMMVFGFGGEADAPRPLTVTGAESKHIGATARPPRPTLEITAFAALMRALVERRTVGELSEITGITKHTVSRNLKHMRAIGLVYVAGWERRRQGGAGGAVLPMYLLGIGRKDVPKPAMQTKQASNARYNAARRQKRHQLRLVRAICANNSVFNQAA